MRCIGPATDRRRSYPDEFSLLILERDVESVELDDRASTQERDPNPAHWLRLELQYRF